MTPLDIKTLLISASAAVGFIILVFGIILVKGIIDRRKQDKELEKLHKAYIAKRKLHNKIVEEGTLSKNKLDNSIGQEKFNTSIDMLKANAKRGEGGAKE